MRWLDVKAGSLFVYKEYGFFKKLWSKIIRKELPFNKYKICFTRMDVVLESTTCKVPDSERYIYLEPVKPYSKVEVKQLRRAVEELIELGKIPNTNEDKVTIINSVRPYTLSYSRFIVNDLFQNKYYKKLYDSKGKNY